MYSRPVKAGGPDPEQILMLAERVEPTTYYDQPQLYPPPPGPRRDLSRTRPARQERAATIRTQPATPPPAVMPEPVPGSLAPAESPVKQIALMGVTQQGDEMTAWLVDLGTQEREVAEAGEAAFGFEVREVGADSVRLAQGDSEYTVRLGEKEIPVVAASEPVTTASAVSTNQGNRNSRLRSGDRGSRSPSRTSSSSYSSRSRSRYSDRRRGRSSSGRTSSYVSGGFPRGFSFRSRGNTANPSFIGPTSNPQEARRLGVGLIGGGTPLPLPEPLQNPQTQRRRGSMSGPAFGQTNSNQRQGRR